MLRKVFAVYDSAAEVFGQPMFVPSRGVAIRSFTDEVNRADANNQLFAHADDFTLYHIGDYDDVKGVMIPAEQIEVAARGKDVKVRT